MLIQITNTCRMLCPHCMQDSGPTSQHMTMETAQLAHKFAKEASTHETAFVWHSLGCEYDLKDGELVLLAEKNGYHLCRYDKNMDSWSMLDGRVGYGGNAMMPLPDVKTAFAEAWEQINHLPWAQLTSLANVCE